jgi:hypothetical protein
MAEKRSFPRTSLPKKAKFFGANGWEDCIITEANRKGFSVQFCTREKINEGSIILLEVPLSSEQEPVTIKGILQWIEKRGESFVGGVEWFSILKSKKGGKIQDS